MKLETGRDALRRKALSVLIQGLEQGHAFVKVHAAEALIEHGQAALVQQVFEKELELAPAPYRTGVWRVLAKALRFTDPAGSEAYLGKLQDAFADLAGPDRPHALEALCKLGASEPLHLLEQTAAEAQGSLQALARWALANQGTAEREAALADLLQSADTGTRATAAYALRHRQALSADTIEKLQGQLLHESAESRARVYLLSAIYCHASAAVSLPPQMGSELLEHLHSAIIERKREACAALASSRDDEATRQLEPLLDDPELDVRIAAAAGLLQATEPQ